MFVGLSVPRESSQISDVEFSPLASNHLFASTWNDQVLLYDCNSIKTDPSELSPVATFGTDSTPLSLLCHTPGSTYVGFLDGTIGEIDLENAKINYLHAVGSKQSSPINHIKRLLLDQNSIIATLINGELICIDPRQRRESALFDVSSSLSSPGTGKCKIFAMDATETNVTLGLSDNSVYIYDSRNLHDPLERRDLGLKHQIRDIKVFPNQQGFAVSTIDGRILMECFSIDPQIQASTQFAFKCHRVYDKKNNIDQVYSVNSLAFHPSLGTLFTGGSDGAVCIWDVLKRKRMKMYPKFTADNVPESVVNMNLSKSGDILAVATSDDSYLRVRAPANLSTHKHNLDANLYVRYLDSTECIPRM